ncbi:MAG TPA: hypothetical protein VMW10_13275 [Alphaproteobacteria bacterium]|nr:hypothetical protein [Alphaproteobacteria bacterium]
MGSVLSPFSKRRGTPPTSPRVLRSEVIIDINEEGEKEKIRENKPSSFTRESELSIPTDNPVMQLKHRAANSVTLLQGLVETEFLVRATELYEKTGDIEKEKKALILQEDRAELVRVGIDMMRFADPEARGENGTKLADALRGQEIFLKSYRTEFKWASDTLTDEGEKKTCDSRFKEVQQERRREKLQKKKKQIKEFAKLSKKKEQSESEQKKTKSTPLITHPGPDRKLRSRTKTIVSADKRAEEIDKSIGARNRAYTAPTNPIVQPDSPPNSPVHSKSHN